MKKTGGPKTAQGKAISSQNAITHGLTSSQATNDDERTLIASFQDELRNYYCPESPLEHLQIERIAICRAKLARLYEVERVRLNIVTQEIKLNPELTLEKIPEAIGVVKAMVLEIIASSAISLPYKMTCSQLEAIVKEISLFAGTINEESDLVIVSPTLQRFLNNFVVIGLEDQSITGRFNALISRVELYLNQDGKLSAKYDELMDLFELVRHVKNQPSAEEIAAQEELDLLIEEQRKRSGVRHPKPLPEKSASADSAKALAWTHEKVIGQLGKLSILHGKYKSALAIFRRYEELRDLQVRSASLQASESDLLMRYQTTLERRLSSAIGELLSLQAKRPPIVRLNSSGAEDAAT